MKSWKAGIFFLIAFFIQCSFLNVISIAGFTPNLLLCLVVVFSFLYEEQIYGLLYGAVFGIFYDICFADVVGPWITLYSLAVITILYAILIRKMTRHRKDRYFR